MIPVIIAVLVFAVLVIEFFHDDELARKGLLTLIPTLLIALFVRAALAAIIWGGAVFIGSVFVPTVKTTTQTQVPVEALTTSGASYVATIRNDDGAQHLETIPGSTPVFHDMAPTEGYLVRRTTLAVKDPVWRWWLSAGDVFAGDGTTTSEVVEVHAPRP